MGLKSKNIIFLLFITILFLLLSLPYTYNLSNDLLQNIGINTSASGCPNIVGILVHSIVFFIIVFLLFVVTKENEPYFRGLANPGRMKMCNSAQLVAQKFKNKPCEKAAKTCLRHPDKNDCVKSLEICNKHKSPIQKYVNNNCKDLMGSLP